MGSRSVSPVKLLATCTVILLFGVLILHQAKNPQYRPVTFYEVAIKHGTDKITTHKYHHMYQKYLGPIRTKPLKLLEIGLGCGVPWGVGASLATWMEWLPNVDLYYLEYDADCAKEFEVKMPNVTFFVGDQSDRNFLRKVVMRTGGEFDVIVDDGGHEFYQQIPSLEVLFEALKPGGTYFVEDLEPAYSRKRSRRGRATLQYVQGLLDDVIAARTHPRRFNLTRDMVSIECMTEICAFTKLTDDQRIADWPGYQI